MSIYDFSVKDIKGNSVPLDNYQGKVLLIVNTASMCGFTKQYEHLESLFKRHKHKGFFVLGFPCNQFGKQEPGSNEEIVDFCKTRFSISFPLFEKINVNGKNAHPLYKFLCQEKTGFLGSRRIKWNFTKFLIDKEGNVMKRFSPAIEPLAIEEDILSLL